MGGLREFPGKSSNFGLLYGRLYGPSTLTQVFNNTYFIRIHNPTRNSIHYKDMRMAPKAPSTHPYRCPEFCQIWTFIWKVTQPLNWPKNYFSKITPPPLSPQHKKLTLFSPKNVSSCTVLGKSTTQRIGNTSVWYEIRLLTDLGERVELYSMPRGC